MSTITLVTLNSDTQKYEIPWTLGPVFHAPATLSGLADVTQAVLGDQDMSAVFFWDMSLGSFPAVKTISKLLLQPVDVWHAGLSLGMPGLPKVLGFCQPTSFVSRDPDPEIEASSWRLHLKACLIRTNVIRELGFLNPAFESLTAGSLELGYRYLNCGAIIRHTPELLSRRIGLDEEGISLTDELLFIHLTQVRRMKYWALFRSMLTRYASVPRLVKAAKQAWSHMNHRYPAYSPSQVKLENIDLEDYDYRVTVLIPTIDRYPYLRVVLDQLRDQTICPYEVIVIDQTHASRRDHDIVRDFSDLPLKLIYQDEPGQCTSRNTGLNISQGEHILFIDDDDEIAPDLIEKHLKNLQRFAASVSSGKADEIGALATDIIGRVQLSSVFPTNNTLIIRTILSQSGLFDLAYNRGQSEDGDLGMRIYLSGALMIYNPQISVVHHRAPVGGLRTHKARVITRASSRTQLLHRRLPHVTECYQNLRYFDAAQVREAMWISAAGTFSIQGGAFRKVLKAIVALAMLPNTIWQLKQRHRAATQMLREYPQIPDLEKQVNDRVVDGNY